MNILIVNGFTEKDKSKKQWFEFEESIKKVYCFKIDNKEIIIKIRD